MRMDELVWFYPRGAHHTEMTPNTIVYKVIDGVLCQFQIDDDRMDGGAAGST